MAHQLLVADDSVTIQRVIKLIFAGEDIRVEAVGDGEQAIAAIDARPPDIVLADVAMPRRTGYEVAEHIRTSPRLAHIPVLLMTAAFETVDTARVSALGCDGVLAKPFEPQAVIALVKQLLARPRAAASGTEPAIGRTELPSIPVTPPGDPDVDAYFERLEQAFAALAAAPRPAAPVDEHRSAPGDGAAPGPESVGLPTPAAMIETGAPLPLTDAQLQLVVDRVLDALAQRLGVPFADVVATVAERVVREEIAEIKRRV